MILRHISRNIVNQSKRILLNPGNKHNFTTIEPLKSEILAKNDDHAGTFNKIVEMDEKPAKNYKTIDGKSSLITNFMVSVKSKNRREKSKMMLLEGKRLINDGIDAGIQPIAVFFSRTSDIANLNLRNNVQLYKIPYKNLQFWSELTTTQGIMAIFPIPDVVNYGNAHQLPLTIICDNIRDPGNLGSILRTSAAVGSTQIILTKGCVDLWEPKVLRSAAGAHFRLNITPSVPWTEIEAHLPEKAGVFLADSDIPEPENYGNVYELQKGEKVTVNEETKRINAFQNRPPVDGVSAFFHESYTEADYTRPAAIILIVGGETEGLSKEAYQLGITKRATRIFVPMANGVESLNSGTALGVVAYEIRRQRLSNNNK